MIKKNKILFELFISNIAGHIFNPVWHSRNKRRKRRGYYRFVMAKKLLKDYIHFLKSLKAPRPSGVDQNESDKIYTIWFQGEEKAPQLVKVCFDRLKQIYGDRVVILDHTNIRENVNLPDYIWKKWEEGKISHAHLSDICRIALLYQHGGMWFDATDFLTSPVPKWIEEADIFMFLEGGNVTPETFIQSCFMRARKGQPLMGMWLESILEYWKNENHIVHYFLLHYMLRLLVENNSEAAEIFYGMPQIEQDPTHTLWHLHYRDPYSEDLYKATTKDSFFQKTTFKVKDATEPIPGSVADVIIKGEAPLPI